MVTKKPIGSKSIWFNTLSILSMILGSLLADESFRDLIGKHAIYIIIGLNIVNMVIRNYTIKPLEFGKDNNEKKLNPIDQALKNDDDEIMGV